MDPSAGHGLLSEVDAPSASKRDVAPCTCLAWRTKITAVFVVVALVAPLVVWTAMHMKTTETTTGSLNQATYDEATQCEQSAIANPLEGRDSRCSDIVYYVTNPPSDGLNITIASTFLLDFKQWHFVMQNHKEYAQQHSLNYFAAVCDEVFQYGDFRRTDVLWTKFPIVQFLFDSGADVVFWMDGDSVFVNKSIDIRNFIALEPGRDLTFSGDLYLVFNNGHFMLRKSNWSKSFLQKSFEICPSPKEDNGAMLVYIGGGTYEQSTWQAAFSKLEHGCFTKEDAEKENAELIDTMKEHVRVLQWSAMNCYDYIRADLIPNGLGSCLIIHAAGYGFEAKTEKLRAWVEL